VSRSPLEPAGMVIVADVPALAPVPGDEAPTFAGGLAAFLSGLQEACGSGCAPWPVRGECGATDALLVLDRAAAASMRWPWTPRPAWPRPRNPAGRWPHRRRSCARRGEHCIVIVTAGEDGCNADLCGMVPPRCPVRRIHVILLAPRLQPGSDPGVPDAGSTGRSRRFSSRHGRRRTHCLADRAAARSPPSRAGRCSRRLCA